MTTAAVIILIVVLFALAAAAFAVVQRRRSSQLQERFGPEYDRVVEGASNRREAEQHLAGVARQRDKLDVRDLDEAERSRYAAQWDVVQARFVDEPAAAVGQADSLISSVMRDRGYPVDDFDERADLVAADHPDVVSHYRAAHEAHERHRATGGLDTEDLRQSFVHYRALFAVLVRPGDPQASDSGPQAARATAPETVGDDTARDDTARDDTVRDERRDETVGAVRDDLPADEAPRTDASKTTGDQRTAELGDKDVRPAHPQEMR